MSTRTPRRYEELLRQLPASETALVGEVRGLEQRGELEQAIKLQRQAIAKGGRNDDFRRRLRTYEAAQNAVAEAQRGVAHLGASDIGMGTCCARHGRTVSEHSFKSKTLPCPARQTAA